MTRGLGAGWLSTSAAIIFDDIRQDDRWITLPDDEGEPGSAIGIPLIGSDRMVRILNSQPSRHWLLYGGTQKSC
ncbi:MAG: GAF domain-containing protein [Anaerolineaceae bacterium]|nr:GAF domain-containing protein [Anaerolineaceae bacterium]